MSSQLLVLNMEALPELQAVSKLQYVVAIRFSWIYLIFWMHLFLWTLHQWKSTFNYQLCKKGFFFIIRTAITPFAFSIPLHAKYLNLIQVQLLFVKQTSPCVWSLFYYRSHLVPLMFSLLLLTLMYLFEIAQTELQAVLKTWAHWGMTKLQNNVFHFVASSFPIWP